MPSNQPVRYATERLVLRLVFTMLAGLFLMYAVPQLWRVLSPFLIAIPISAALQPAIRLCQQKLRMKRGVAVMFWVLLVCAIAFVLLYWFASFAVVQIIGAANNASNIVNDVVGILQDAADRILGAVENLPPAIGLSIRSSLDSAFNTISDTGLSLASSLVNALLSFAAAIPYAFVYANFLVLGVFFITGRYGSMQSFLKSRFASSKPREDDSTAGESISVLRQSTTKGVVGYIRVQLLFFAVIFLLSWIYFQSFGFSYAILIGIGAAFLELIPQFGCGTLYLPWAAISFLVNSDRNAWIVLGFYMAYALIRRLTEPMLLGTNLGVSPLLSLIGMFIGMQLAGVVGLVAGPIIIVVLVSATRAHLFDAIKADFATVYRHMQSRWNRGRKRVV
ncbi:MAG: AI-2E family transporter [Clostridiales bacterium]|nr:AI-2E family transporter [Clostridiales bacterium]